MPGPLGPVCQSCGMPMSRDPAGGGTEARGGRSDKFCSHCYDAGKFRSPDMTLPEMMQLVEDKLVERHFPRFMARWMTKSVPQLERWR